MWRTEGAGESRPVKMTINHGIKLIANDYRMIVEFADNIRYLDHKTQKSFIIPRYFLPLACIRQYIHYQNVFF